MQWARVLQRWKLDGIAAFLLEAGGPFIILAAQVIYIGQPFLRQAMSEGHFHALVNLFEDQEEGQMFITFLREQKSL
jgi:hypothetical protein